MSHRRCNQRFTFTKSARAKIVAPSSWYPQATLFQNLGLIIADRGVKPACAMKTLSGTVGFALLAVIAIIIVLTIRPLTFATPTPIPTPTPCPTNLPQRNFILVIGGPGGPPGSDGYVNVDKARLDAALSQLGGNTVYKLSFKSGQGHVKDCYHPGDQVNIKTDKVITSQVAKNASAGGSAVNDPHLMYRVQSNDVTDIQKVLGAF